MNRLIIKASLLLFLDSKDFQTVWQLAHHWISADPNETDCDALSPELKDAIHRLMLAISNKDITARTKRWIILLDDSVFMIALDSFHRMKFYHCLKRNKFNKSYLDSLYVKRNEVFDWCKKAYLDPPPCWAIENSLAKQENNKSVTKNRPKTEEADRLACQTVASALWMLDADIHPIHMVRSKIMQRIGNARHYTQDSIKKWIGEVDSLKDQRKPGKTNY